MSMRRVQRALSPFVAWVSRAPFDVRYLIAGGSWLTLGQVIQWLSALLAAMVFARWWDPYTYGTYKYLLALGELTSLATLTGAPILMVRELARGNTERYHTLLSWWRWSLGLQAVVAGAISAFYVWHHNFVFAVGALIAAGGYATTHWFARTLAVAHARTNFAFVSLTAAVATVAHHLGALIGVVAGTGVLGTLSFAMAGSALVYALAHATYRTHLPPQARQPASNPTLRTTVREVLELSLNQTLGGLAPRLLTVLTFHAIGPAAVAALSFSMMLPRQLSFFGKALFSLALPRFARRHPATIYETLPFKWFAVFAATAVVVAAYWVMAPTLFQFLFPRYVSFVPFSRWFSLSYLILVPSLLVYTALVAHHAHRLLTLGWVVAGTLLVGATVILAPFLGVAAPLIGYVLYVSVLSVWWVSLARHARRAVPQDGTQT